LAVAIGRPEHPGRVRGVGKFVGIRQFFGPPSANHNKVNINEEVIMSIKEEMREQMREEIREEIKKEMKKEYFDMKAQLLSDMRAELASPSAQPCNPHQQPSIICVSTKGSCDVPLEEASLIGDADYELFIDDLLQSLVALGNLSNYIVLHVFVLA